MHMHTRSVTIPVVLYYIQQPGVPFYSAMIATGQPPLFYQTKKKVPLLFHKKKKEFFLKPADTQCISNYSIPGFSILSIAHVTIVLIKKQSGCHRTETRSLIIGTFFKTSEKYQIALTVLRFPLI